MSLFDGSFCPEIPSPRQTAILPPPTKAFQGAMYTKSLGHRSVSTAGFRLKRVKDLALICISQGTHGRHRRHMYQKAHLEVPGTLVYQNSCQWNGHRPRGLSRCKLPFEGRGENTGQQRTTTTKTSATGYPLLSLLPLPHALSRRPSRLAVPSRKAWDGYNLAFALRFDFSVA